jgi:hypothetical protein
MTDEEGAEPDTETIEVHLLPETTAGATEEATTDRTIETRAPDSIRIADGTIDHHDVSSRMTGETATATAEMIDDDALLPAAGLEVLHAGDEGRLLQ